MKHIFIGILLLLVFGFLYIQSENNTLIETNTSQISKNKEPKRYDQPDKAARWLMELRQTPDNKTTPSQLNNRYKSEIESYELAKRTSMDKSSGSDGSISKLKFENIGPSNFGGRIRGFVIKTDDSNQLLAGGVSGGVFKSDNQGQSWRAISDFLPTLAIGSMITDPDNPNRVFIGTGEGFFNFAAARGAGMFVSEDFGETWNQLASTDNSDFYYVNRMARVPNSNIILAATQSGIFRSENLGQSWIEVSGYETTSRGFVDLKIDPSNANRMLASHYGSSNEALLLTIVSPDSIAGGYNAVQAGFGPSIPTNGTGNKNIVLVDDGTGTTNDACEAISTDLTGKIALAQRGSCNFTVKVLNAQSAGALAVVIYQNTDDAPFTMGGSEDLINIPSVMISKTDGETLVAETESITGNIQISAGAVPTRFIMESLDSGNSWSILDNNGLPDLNVGRMELAIANDGVSYVAIANINDTTLGLWKAPSNSSFFAKTNSNTPFIERQGWYDLAIGVNPNNSSNILLGAIDQFSSSNGGDTIIQNSTWVPASNGGTFGISKYIHSDHHGYVYDHNNPDVVYVVGDGGVSKSINNGVTFKDSNTGLSISQSYGIAVSSTGESVISGTQDNGAHMFFGDNNSWLRWAGGDGGYSAWDQQSDNFIYGSFPAGGMYGSSTRGRNISSMELPDTTGARFIQPFALNKNDGNQLIVGTDNVFYSNNARSLFQATFQDISGNLGSSVNAVSFSESVTNQIYAGTIAGKIFKIDNIGSQNTLSEITPTASDGLASLSGAITDIKTFNDNTIFATRASYFGDRVIMSHDSGNSWNSISGNLPNIPVYQITIDPKHNNILYIGTELGLWVTDLNDNNHEWVRYDYGIAYTRVIDFAWYNQDTLYIGTYGRGTYRATREIIDISINKFVTTNSSIDNDGILDSGESGLFMLNLKNNSGYDVIGADLDLSISGLAETDNIFVDLATIPAHSSLIVPINASLPADTLCLSNIDFQVDLNYDGTINQQADLSVISAANIHLSYDDFVENAESSDTLMTSELKLGTTDWIQVSTAANSGSKSWVVDDEFRNTDKSLVSPWLLLNDGGNKIDFSLKYNTQGTSIQAKDGVMLELREEGGSWIDIGHLSTVPYDGQLFNNNSAQGRSAWSGNKNTWRQASVNLEETFKGKTIQFRFRMVTDTSIGGEGFWVDDIRFSNVIRDANPECDENVSTGGTVPFSGLWFDRGKNGHGFAIEPVGVDNLYFIIFYTYDDEGKPEWYSSVTTLEDGVLNANFVNGSLEKFIYDYSIDPAVSLPSIRDPSIFDGRLSVNFNSSEVISQNACQDGVGGRDTNTVAIAKWKINDQEGEWCIEPIIKENLKLFPDMSGTWYAGFADAGWGFSIAQAQNQFISINYYYDSQGLPRWSIGSSDGFAPNTEFLLQLTEVNGFGRTQTPIDITTVPSGFIKFNLKNALNNISIDGTASVNFDHQGNAGGQWTRDNIPITIFTQTH